MRRYEQRVTVTDEREVVVRLPSDFPPGEAHFIVHSTAAAPARSTDLAQWLDDWIASLPKVPHLPDSAFDRDSIYR